MSRWSLRSEWRYSKPLSTSRRMMAICISSKLPAFIKSRAEPPPRYSIMIQSFVSWWDTRERDKTIIFWEKKRKHFDDYFEVGSVITCDVWTVALRQHHNLLLDVFDFIFGFFQVDDFDGNYLLRPVVNAFKHFTKRAFADPLLFCEDQFRIHFLHSNKQQQQNIQSNNKCDVITGCLFMAKAIRWSSVQNVWHTVFFFGISKLTVQIFLLFLSLSLDQRVPKTSHVPVGLTDIKIMTSCVSLYQ